MDPATLVNTIKKYNSYVDAGNDPNLVKVHLTLNVKLHHFMQRLVSQLFTIQWVA